MPLALLKSVANASFGYSTPSTAAAAVVDPATHDIYMTHQLGDPASVGDPSANQDALAVYDAATGDFEVLGGHPALFPAVISMAALGRTRAPCAPLCR